jgi:hypothetical protein
MSAGALDLVYRHKWPTIQEGLLIIPPIEVPESKRSPKGCEVHEGDCQNCFGGRALVHKALRRGCHWLFEKGDAQSCVRRCDKC